MMKAFDKTFCETYCKETFDEFLSDSIVELSKTNKEYQELLNKKQQILDECPKLRKIIEDVELVELNKNETKYVSELEISLLNIATFESKEMFIKGMQEAYYLFKKLKIIK